MGAGLVVPPEDAETLLSGVLELAEDDDLLQVFRLAAHTHATTRLNATSSLEGLTTALLQPVRRVQNI